MAIIGKIIDNRSAKLQRLQKCFSEFELVSSVGDISTMSTGVKDFDELQSHLTERTLDLISKSQVLIIEIFGNTGIGCSKKIYQSISRLQSATQKIIDYYYAGALEPINPNMLDKYIEAHQEFVTEQAHYLIKTEEILNAISYEDVSLADIRDFINSTSKKQEDFPMNSKLPLQTPNLTAQNIDKIAALFPNCITEMLDEEKSTPDHKVYKRGINFELLKQMLSPDVVDGDEAYEFTWVGKKASIVEANKPIRKTLRPCPAESKNWDDTENLSSRVTIWKCSSCCRRAIWAKSK